MDDADRLARLEADVAVIRAELTNHVTNLREDVAELRTEARSVRDKLDRLIQLLAENRTSGGHNGAREWRAFAFQSLGWFVALLLAVLQFVLGRLPSQ
jgi:uncharacterized coiled-coil protein SlyX